MSKENKVNTKSILEMAHGAIMERADYEMKKVLDNILDPHVGSASSLIACYEMGFDYIGFELDQDYFKAATERLEAVKAQVRFPI